MEILVLELVPSPTTEEVDEEGRVGQVDRDVSLQRGKASLQSECAVKVPQKQDQIRIYVCSSERKTFCVLVCYSVRILVEETTGASALDLLSRNTRTLCPTQTGQESDISATHRFRHEIITCSVYIRSQQLPQRLVFNVFWIKSNYKLLDNKNAFLPKAHL